MPKCKVEVTLVGEADRVRVAFDTLGCKVNQAETQELIRKFAEAGYEICSPEGCDIYVLNTCTVTHVADRKSRHLLRMARRRNPAALVVATGCYAERAQKELSRDAGVDIVVGGDRKADLPRLLEETGRVKKRDVASAIGHSVGWRTRAFVKVQDGCNSYCTYCIVPVVRGREKSVPVAEVVSEVRERVIAGYKEVLLTGVKVGAYRYGGTALKGLLERVLSETGVVRLRLSSLQPQEISTELVGLWRDPRLCRHFHLSIQSGSDTVLRRMGRQYSVPEYTGTIGLIRSLVPEAAVTTDVIVGFPGETDAEFQESYDVCRRTGFARIHVFPYSARKGTPAARLSPSVPEPVRKERTVKMIALAGKSARDFCQRFLGRAMDVLWEKADNGVWSGLTDNYIRVYARSDRDLTNCLTPARLLAIEGDGVSGDVEGPV